MGCLLIRSAKVHPTTEPRSTEAQDPNSFEQIGWTKIMSQDFLTIMGGVARIPNPINLSAVVCFHEKAAPLAIAPVTFDGRTKSSISLPAMGFSRAGVGRIILIGQVQILVQCAPECPELSFFLEKITKWSANVPRGVIKILVYGLPEQFAEKVRTNLEYFGYKVKISQLDDPDPQLNKSNVIICQSNCNHPDALEAFLDHGGGLICCTPHTSNDNDFGNHLLNRFRTNAVTAKYGIAFPPVKLQLGSLSSPAFRTSLRFNDLYQISFPHLTPIVIDLLNKNLDNLNSCTLEEIDSLIATLRYHIMAIPRGMVGTALGLGDLYNTCLKTLEVRNAISEFGMCPEPFDGVIASLICELLPKLPIASLSEPSKLNFFPGNVAEELFEATVDIEVHGHEWCSTGLYLPPNVVCKVQINNFTKNSRWILQIGSHTENLLINPGPWKRFPICFNSFILDNGEVTEICSIFGGIIYFLKENFEVLEKKLSASFSQVTRYPIYRFDSPEEWEKTKDLKIPYGELICKDVIFVLPTEVLLRIKMDHFVTKINNITKILTHILGKGEIARVIFDIELPNNGPVCGYPIFLSEDDLSEIAFTHEPTMELFRLSHFLATLLIPSDIFVQERENLLTHIAVQSTFEQIWPDWVIQSKEPPGFKELWTLHIQNKKVIPRALRKLFDEEGASWQLFVTIIEGIVGRELPELKDMQTMSSSLIRGWSSFSLRHFEMSSGSSEGSENEEKK